jgi:hypothetical protein
MSPTPFSPAPRVRCRIATTRPISNSDLPSGSDLGRPPRATLHIDAEVLNRGLVNDRLGVLLWCLAARTDNFDDHAALKDAVPVTFAAIARAAATAGVLGDGDPLHLAQARRPVGKELGAAADRIS